MVNVGILKAGFHLLSSCLEHNYGISGNNLMVHVSSDAGIIFSAPDYLMNDFVSSDGYLIGYHMSECLHCYAPFHAPNMTNR